MARNYVVGWFECLNCKCLLNLNALLILSVLFLAPSIYENEDVKKGILLQLFGGNRKDFSNTGRGKFR